MRRALFLDRDGVINRDDDYVHTFESFVWQPGIFELTRAARDCGAAIVVVTNQSGIGRGLYTEEQFQALTRQMCAQFQSEGVEIAAVYHCPYHPQAALAGYRRDHPWRKPQPGMLLAAAADHALDLPSSAMIGDRSSDMAAAEAAGVATRIRLAGSDAFSDKAACSVVADLWGAARALEHWFAQRPPEA